MPRPDTVHGTSGKRRSFMIKEKRTGADKAIPKVKAQGRMHSGQGCTQLTHSQLQ